MDGSDDYEFDDLDDDALATIDQIEQSYLTQAHAPPPPSPPKPPPPKRQKTSHDGQFRNRPSNPPGIKRADSSDLSLPEVSLQPDGSYRVGSTSNTTRVGTRPPVPAPRQSQFSRHTREISSARPYHQPALKTTSLPQTAHPPRPFVSPQHIPSPVDHHRHPPAYARTPESVHYSGSVRSVNNNDALQAAAQMAPSHNADDALELRRRVEELEKEKEKIQEDLAQAKEVRMAKEGEVTILRRNMAKSAQDHAAQLAKLRVAKEEAEAKRKQAEKEAKEEMERMKTQLIFQQHESLAFGRNAPGTQRAKKIGKDAPGTPLPMPSQMRNWTQGSAVAGPSNLAFETPRKPQRPINDYASPKTSRFRKPTSPEINRKSSVLPGFENAFAPSSPSRPTRTLPMKLTQRNAPERRDPAAQDQSIMQPPPLRVPDWQGSFGAPPPSPRRSPDRVEPIDDFDVQMADAPQEAIEDEMMDIVATTSPEEELDDIPPINWKLEMSRIISTHHLPSLTTLTLQALIQANDSPALPQDSAQAYSSACASILKSLSSPATYDVVAQSIANSLVSVLAILTTANLIHPLAPLLNLLMTLCYSLPKFTAALLSIFHEETEPPLLTCQLCSLIASHLDVKNPSEYRDALGREILALLQALCWNVPEDLEPKLASIPFNKDAMTTLTQPSQPDWLLLQSVRLLNLLATYPKLFKPLLALPATDEVPLNNHRPAIIDRLSYLLCDNRKGEKADVLRRMVVHFFALLAGRQPDAIVLFAESYSLLPAMVVYLSNLVAPIWEDDEALMTQPALVPPYVDAIGQALSLLYSLVFNSNNPANLLARLQYATPRYFNGVSHVFIVTMGRLSYAEAPDWLGSESVLGLERVIDMARELIELVADGPEGDAIWAVYQGAEQGEDEEEMEAELLGDARGS
ncbi:hypothetical protein HGRIS_002641 [Hohenbuehelia grisea]|uniref:Uncharacterized protein n=1 Tax=Hohenbuehelia grisea TaxID=104357 RepID=A0ABR3JLU4_9AGAR